MKHKAIDLIRAFFGASNKEMLELPKEERYQLASAIARDAGYTPDTLDFEQVAY
jgi:hypothetical protein